jgi:hypothetical protein
VVNFQIPNVKCVFQNTNHQLRTHGGCSSSTLQDGSKMMSKTLLPSFSFFTYIFGCQQHNKQQQNSKDNKQASSQARSQAQVVPFQLNR